MSERFDTMLQVRTPAELVHAIDKTASRELVTRSDYVRRAVIERLRADGVKLQPAIDEVA
jgi:metal-responsive CopG/Arc/MetJ family transcriptional regulator